MSFDVFLQRFAAGESAEVNRERVRAVLQATQFTEPDDFGFCVVKFPDGVQVELTAEGLNGAAPFTGCTFHIYGVSPHVTRFILEIAKAGDMVMLPAMQDFVPILSAATQRQELPSAMVQGGPEPVVCGSPDELESLLSGGYTGWQKYRDKLLHEKRGV